MDAHKHALWPRCLSLLLALALLTGLLPAALASDIISINTSGGTSVEVGKTLTLHADIQTGENETAGDVSWSCTGDAASIDSNGTVTGNKAGTVTITASVTVTKTETVTTERTETDTCTITVTEPVPVPVPVTGVTLSPTSLTLTAGEQKSLSATVSPSDADNKSVSWSSNNDAIATVNSNGLVTGVTAGTAAITVTTEDGGKTASCTVTVKAAVTAIPVTGITLSATSASLAVGEARTLTATVAPTNATNQNVTWSTSNSSVATVSNGIVTGVAAGSAVITAAAQDGSGKSAACTVTVTAASLALNKNSVTLSKGGSATTVTATTAPASSAASVKWSVVGGTTSAVSITPATGATCTVTPVAVGSTTLRATVTISGQTFTKDCTVTVTNPSAANVSYSTAKGEPVTFNAADFNTACRGLMNRDLNYVTFTLPSSSSGTLYYNYSDGDYDREITSSDQCKRTGSPALSSVTFLPKSTRTGDVTISYTGWDTQGYQFTGNVVISITSSSGVVSYSTAKNTPVTLDNTSFNDFSKDVNSSNFDYVQFTLPSSSYGTLYYNYESSGNYERAVSSNTKYYRSSSYYLSEITFVPKNNYTGTVNIPFTGRSSDGASLSGTLRIYVGVNSNSDVSYTIAVNDTAALVEQDFIDYSKDATGATFDYVQFTPPTSSKGFLYYNYRTSSSSNTKVTSGTRYYRNSSPYLENITFVPAKDYEGTVSIPFTGYNTDGEKFTGTLRIYVGDGAGDVTYTATVGAPVTFAANDFNTYCKEQTASNLDYVRFTLPGSSSGTLYYDYNASTGKYDSRVTSNTSYNRSSTPKVGSVTFVPASGVTGTVSIPFTGRSTNSKSFSGTVVISYASPLKQPAVIRYSTPGTPVVMNASDFNAASTGRGGAALNSVTFTLPNSAYGKLYNSYSSPASHGGQVSPAASYYYTSSPALGNVSFVPKAGFNGVAYIQYSGRDVNGSTYTGSVEISVTPNSTSSSFTDVGYNYNWAAPSVDFLHRLGVVQGTGGSQFSPAMTMTRCDYILMLYRAFSLPAHGTSSFPDVPANSYYAEAIASAKALGIVTADANGNFNPLSPVTRQDSMLFLQLAMRTAGQSMPDGPASALAAFSDQASVSSAALGAVAAMVQAGIIKGDGSGHLNPNASLSRAEMVTILHRALTM